MRTSEIEKRPVVTLAGDDVAQIKDVVYSAGGGEVGGFTLAGRGLFAGPSKQALAWRAVSALGADAVMIDSVERFEPVEAVLEAAAAAGGSGGSAGAGGNVLGSRVLTDAGVDLGKVVDVVVEVADGPDPAGGTQCDVVGYEIEASEALKGAGTRLLIPLPDTLAASGEHLMVPAAAQQFVRADLAGFGAAVDDFRAALREGA